MAWKFTEALQELDGALAEVEGTVHVIELVTKLRPRIGQLVTWNELGPMKSTVKDFADAKEFSGNAVYQALIVVVHGVLERFLRRVVKETVEQIDRATSEFDTLENQLVVAHLTASGRVFARAADPPEHMRLDFDTLCRNMGTCVKGSTDFSLNSDAFAVSVRDVSRDTIDNALRHIGIILKWDEMCDTAGLRSACDTKKARGTTKAVCQRLRELSQARNNIAHNGMIVQVIDDIYVKRAVTLCQEFAHALAKGASTALGKVT